MVDLGFSWFLLVLIGYTTDTGWKNRRIGEIIKTPEALKLLGFRAVAQIGLEPMTLRVLTEAPNHRHAMKGRRSALDIIATTTVFEKTRQIKN